MEGMDTCRERGGGSNRLPYLSRPVMKAPSQPRQQHETALRLVRA
jgi:hypothetical protein